MAYVNGWKHLREMLAAKSGMDSQLDAYQIEPICIPHTHVGNPQQGCTF